MSSCVNLIIVFLMSLVFVHGRNALSNTNNEITSMTTEKEGRSLIVLPLIGTILLIVFKVAGLIISPVLSLLEYKMAAVALLSNLASWVYENFFLVIMGTAAVAGFCLLTSAFTVESDHELDPRLIQAGRSLEQGLLKYGRLI